MKNHVAWAVVIVITYYAVLSAYSPISENQITASAVYNFNYIRPTTSTRLSWDAFAPNIAPFQPYITEASELYNVPPEFIMSIIRVESSGRTLPGPGGAVCNSAGYCGLMQVNKGKCDILDDDLCDWNKFIKGDEGARDQIMAGTRYIGYLITRGIQNLDSQNPDWYFVAVGYNGGEGTATELREVVCEKVSCLEDYSKISWADVTKDDIRKAIANMGLGWGETKVTEIYDYASFVMDGIRQYQEYAGEAPIVPIPPTPAKFLLPVKPEAYPAGIKPALTAAFHSRAYYNWVQAKPAEERGAYVNGEHQGIDITGVDSKGNMNAVCGPGVYSIADGRAEFNFGGRFGGNWIKVVHDGGWSSVYLHVQDFAGSNVGDSKIVKAGDLIGHIGESASAGFCHLHFELFYNGERTDPVPRPQSQLPCGQAGWCKCDETLFGGCNPANAPLAGPVITPTPGEEKPVPEVPTPTIPSITIPKGVKGISYSIMPSFRTHIDYNFENEYKFLADKAKILADCGSHDLKKGDVKKCIEDNINIEGGKLNLQLGGCEGERDDGPNFRFCATSPAELEVYDDSTKQVEKKPVQYRFALYIPFCSEEKDPQTGETTRACKTEIPEPKEVEILLPEIPSECSGDKNPFGIHTFFFRFDYNKDQIKMWLDVAKEMVGKCGWIVDSVPNFGGIQVGRGMSAETEQWREWDLVVFYLKEAQSRDLRVIIRASAIATSAGVYAKPDAGPDGDHALLATNYELTIRRLKESGVNVEYLQIWNEPNLKVEWGNEEADPVEFAKYYVTVAKKIKESHPEIKLLSTPMAIGPTDSGAGRTDNIQFIKAMFSSEYKDDLVKLIDVWSSHSYFPMHTGYAEELEAVRTAFESTGKPLPPVMITETGTNVMFTGHPDESPANVRAKYGDWLNDPRVISINPFLLNTKDPLWESREWVKDNGELSEAYKTVKELRTEISKPPTHVEIPSTPFGIQIDLASDTKVPDQDTLEFLSPSWVRFVYLPNKPLPKLPSGVKSLVIFNHQSAGPAPLKYINGIWNSKWYDIDEWKEYTDNIYVPKLREMVQNNPVDAVEIWNEEEICVTGYCPEVPPEAYAYMLNKAAAAIKNENENIKVVMGGLASSKPYYIEEVKAIDSTAFNNVDAVGIHPYEMSPDGWCKSGCPFSLPGDLRETINEYRDASPVPIWVTEVGQWTDDRELQAEYLRKVFTVMEDTEVPVVIWYGWTDLMKGVGTESSTWGLFDISGDPNPAGNEFRTLTTSTITIE